MKRGESEGGEGIPIHPSPKHEPCTPPAGKPQGGKSSTQAVTPLSGRRGAPLFLAGCPSLPPPPTCAPHIRLERVVLLEHLWRHVEEASGLVCQEFPLAAVRGQAKVNHLEGVVLAGTQEQEVVRFDIPAGGSNSGVCRDQVASGGCEKVVAQLDWFVVCIVNVRDPPTPSTLKESAAAPCTPHRQPHGQAAPYPAPSPRNPTVPSPPPSPDAHLITMPLACACATVISTSRMILAASSSLYGPRRTLCQSSPPVHSSITMSTLRSSS